MTSSQKIVLLALQLHVHGAHRPLKTQKKTIIGKNVVHVFQRCGHITAGVDGITCHHQIESSSDCLWSCVVAVPHLRICLMSAAGTSVVATMHHD